MLLHGKVIGDCYKVHAPHRPGVSGQNAASLFTSSSWLNLIERWFGELTSKRIRRSSFLDVNDLVVAIHEFMAAWNDKPFVWTATVESILAKLSQLPPDSGTDPAWLHASQNART